MKKNVWLLGVAVAALTSCTQNEVLEVPESKLIRFEEFVEKNSRAELAEVDLTNTSLSKYWVYGYYTEITGYEDRDHDPATPDAPVYDFSTEYEEVFNGMSMTKNGDSWTYGATKLWRPEHMYRFAAYSNGNESVDNVTYNPATDILEIPNYIIEDNSDITNITDLNDLVASIAGDRAASSGGTPVQFAFKHLLSKVTLYITNQSDNANITLSDIEISDMAKQGTCKCSYSGTTAYPKNVVWSGLDESEIFSFGELTINHGVSTQTHGEVTFYVIPQSNEKTISFTLSETVDGESTPHKTVPLHFNLAAETILPGGESMENKWVPGYHYRYTLSRGTTFNQIQFNVSVADWEKDRDGNGNDEDADNVPLS